VDTHPFARAGAAGGDPAVLAFVKCHLTSVARYEVLRALALDGGGWRSPAELARQLHHPEAQVGRTLAELAAEGLVEEAGDPQHGPAFRLDPDDPTTRVMERLVRAATHDQELRQLIVARIVQGRTPAA
jgi:DNA-binding MarR family transcriptional regulator